MIVIFAVDFFSYYVAGPDDEIDFFLNYTITPPDSRVQVINETTSELRIRGGVSEITITIAIQVDSRTETTEMFLLFLTGTRRVNSVLTPVGNVTILDTREFSLANIQT